MSSITLGILSSPYLLYTTSVISFILARSIIYRVRNKGPIPIARTLIKYNSRGYAFASLLLFLAILDSFWREIVDTSHATFTSIICSPSTTKYDEILRYLYHLSKFYEYVDIFNVLGSGGEVNAHFGFHHFTTPYLTYARALKNSAGWKLFAGLNTLHHALMYAYFGGATIFTDIIVWTGCLQYAVGIGAELFAILRGLSSGREDCGGRDTLWANVLALLILSTYAILFSGDLRAREKNASDGKKEQ